MNKKRIALILIPTFFLLICIIGLILYDRHTYGEIRLSFSEKKELGEIIAKYDCLSLDFIGYMSSEKCYRINCNYTKSEIDEEVFNKGVALYNEIMDYSGRSNNIFNGEKLELTIRNGSSLDYLILRNFDENVKDACQKECSYVTISYYVGKTNKVYESDIESFKEKKYDEVLV